MAETIAELRELSDDEIIRRHDQKASNTGVGTHHYLAELARRDQDRASDVMLAYTRQIKIMTVIVTVATIISTLLVAWSLFR
jgi:hypothetical protein